MVVAPEPFSINVQMTGRGLVYPGAGAQTGPTNPYSSSEFAVSGEYTSLRSADVTGSISSPTLGTFSFTGNAARFGVNRRETLMPFATWEG